MFEKISGKNCPSVVIAEGNWYIIAEDKDKHRNWMCNNSFSRLEATMTGTNKLTEAYCPDGIVITEELEKREVEASSIISFNDNGKSRRIAFPYAVAVRHGMRMVYMTESGRPFTDEERRRFCENAQWAFQRFASTMGALYMRLDIDGKKSFWYDDDSCYGPCSTPREVIAQMNKKDLMARNFKAKGFDQEALTAITQEIDDLRTEMKDADLDDEDAAVLNMLDGLNSILEKAGSYMD